MSGEITLPVGATAEPDTCGSCKFFSRYMDRYYGDEGSCRIVMPPPKTWLVEKQFSAVDDSEYRATNDMKDTQRCDLQRPDGKSYIVQRKVPS